MGNVTFWLLFDSVIKICLFWFALRYAKNIYLQLNGCILTICTSKLSQTIIYLFTAASFMLYIVTGGIISYEFAVYIAELVVEITAYSNPYTESAVIAFLALLIFKQLSAVTESFLSDITAKIFLFAYNDSY